MENNARRHHHGMHTITIDTPHRKNTVIGKNGLAIVTEQKPIPETTKEQQKPRLIHWVACKIKNNEKILTICLEEAKQLKAANKQKPTVERPSRRDIRTTIKASGPPKERGIRNQ